MPLCLNVLILLPLWLNVLSFLLQAATVAVAGLQKWKTEAAVLAATASARSEDLQGGLPEDPLQMSTKENHTDKSCSDDKLHPCEPIARGRPLSLLCWLQVPMILDAGCTIHVQAAFKRSGVANLQTLGHADA